MDTNSLFVNLEERGTGAPVMAGGVTWEVERLEWRAMGGPWSARLVARANSLAQLWALGDLLRCGVKVNDEQGPAWWGYMAGVELVNGARRVRVGLEEMANKVAISYRDFSPLASGGEAKTTAYLSQRDSVKTYGEKERVFAIGQASAGDAAVVRARTLGEVGLPVKTFRTLAGSGLYAVVDCRGWWETLDWKNAGETRGLIFNSASGANQNFGTPGEQRVTQTFSMPADAWRVSEVWLRIRREQAPADGVTLNLCRDNAGVPGIVVVSATVAAGAIDDGYKWVRFVFAAPVNLAPGTYWLVLLRTGALNGTAFYMVSADQAQGYPGGQAYVYGGSWAARLVPADLNMCVVGVEETTEQVRRLLAADRCGQFFTDVRFEASSGISTRMYRDGNQRGQTVIEGLLGMGTYQGGRLLGRVESGRMLRIYKQANASTAGRQNDVMIDAAGELCAMDGRRLPASRWPAGRWALVGELEGAGATGVAVFVNGCVWEGGRMVMG